jgi:DNA-binding MarR family transcriptional regulator
MFNEKLAAHLKLQTSLYDLCVTAQERDELTADQQTVWLSAAESRTWISLSGVLLKLPSALDVDLKQRAGLSHFEYLVMSVISETEARSLPMGELATLANSSASRLSHVVSRLEERGWISRSPSPENGRIIDASLTDRGFAVLAAAAPGHVSLVHEMVFGALSAAQVRQLGTICDAVLGRLDPGQDWPPPSTRK